MSKFARVFKGIIFALLLALLIGGICFGGVYIGYRAVSGPDYVYSIGDEQFEEKDAFSENGFSGYIGDEFAYITDVACAPAYARTDLNGYITIPDEINGKPARLTSKVFISVSLNRSVIKGVRLEEGNQYYVVENDTLFNADKTKVLYYFGSERDIVIPEGVTEICESAYQKISLNSVTLPDGLERVDSGAFSSCGLTSLKLPDSVTVLEDFAFGGNCICDLKLSASLKEIGYRSLSCLSVDELVLPQGIKKISNGAFSEGNIKSITFPSSLESVGHEPLERCTGLEEINILCSPDAFEGDICKLYYEDICKRYTSSVEMHDARGSVVFNTAETLYPCDFVSTMLCFKTVIINEPCPADGFDYTKGYTEAKEHGHANLQVNADYNAFALQLSTPIKSYDETVTKMWNTTVRLNFAH